MHAGMTTANSDHLIRSELWSSELKEMLKDELAARGFVRWLTEFPDGDTFNIPSIGEAVVRDYHEDDPIIYDAIDTGEFKFQITEYLSAATYITDKNKQDMFYMNELVSQFSPKQLRAIMEQVETTILALSNQQTLGDLNSINGAAHRFVASGAGGALAPADFAKALYALKKANVPQRNLVAIVDPSTEYYLNTLTNLVNVSDNPRWEGIIADGIAQDMRFVKNVYGFDVFTSNYLPQGLTETIDGNSTAAGDGVANLFMSADMSISPFIGAWRQQPRVESERNKDRQRDEFVTTARYGVKLYRPENLVTVLSNQSIV